MPIKRFGQNLERTTGRRAVTAQETEQFSRASRERIASDKEAEERRKREEQEAKNAELIRRKEQGAEAQKSQLRKNNGGRQAQRQEGSQGQRGVTNPIGERLQGIAQQGVRAARGIGAAGGSVIADRALDAGGAILDRVSGNNKASRAINEGRKVVEGIPARAVEGALNLGSLALDTAGTAARSVFGVEDNSTNPFHPEYVERQFETGIAVPDTDVGKMVQGFATFATTTVLGAGALGAGKAATKVGAFARGEAASAFSDFLLSKGGDSNVSGFVRSLDFVPDSIKNNMILDLIAADQDSTAYGSRVKNAIEGFGISGAAAGMINGFMRATRNMKAGAKAAQAGADIKALPSSEMRAAQVAQEADALRKAGKPQEADKVLFREFRRQIDAEARLEAQNAIREGDLHKDVELRLQDKVETQRLDTEQRLQQLKEEGRPSTDPDLRKAQDDLDRIMADADAVRSRIDTEYSPGDMRLQPQETNGNWTPGNVTRAIASEVNPPRGTPPPTEALRQLEETLGMPPSQAQALTDAQTRLMGFEGEAKKFIRDVEKDPELQELLKGGRTKDAEVLREGLEMMDSAYQIMSDGTSLEDAFRSIDGLNDIINSSGEIQASLLTNPGMIALRRMISDTGMKAYELSKGMDAVDAAKAGTYGNMGERMVESLVAQMALLQESSSAMGRGLRTMGMDLGSGVANRAVSENAAKAVPKIQQVIDKLESVLQKLRTGDPDGVKELKQITRGLAITGGDPKKQASFLKSLLDAQGEISHNVYINSLFSGPATQLRNVIGNLYTSVERPTAMMLHSGMGVLDPSEFRTAMAGYKATVTGINQSLQLAFSAARTGRQKFSGGEKYIRKNSELRAQLQRMMDTAENPIEKAAVQLQIWQHNLVDSGLVNYGTNFLGAADDGFQALQLRQWQQMVATKQALMDPSALKGDTGAYVNKYLAALNEAKLNADGSIKDADLKEWIAQGTFQGNTTELTKAAANFLDKLPLGNKLVPVVNTSSEIIRFNFKNTPGLNRWADTEYFKVKEAARAGDPEALLKEAVMDGRTAIGGLLMTSAGLFASQFGDEFITGYGPAGQKNQEEWSRGGERQRTSVRIGGRWVDYSILPIAPLIALAVDAATQAKMGGLGAETLGQLVFSISAGTFDQSYFAGLQQAQEFFNPENLGSDGFKASIGNIINTQLGWAGARRFGYNWTMPYQMELESQNQANYNALMGGTDIVGAEKLDPLTGKFVPSYSGGGINSWFPVRINPAGNDPVLRKLYESGFRLPKKGVVVGYELKPDEKQALHGAMYSLGLKERLEAVMNQPGFDQLVEAWDGRIVDYDTDVSLTPPHLKALQSEYRAVEREAIEYMKAKDDRFNRIVLGAKAQRELADQGITGPGQSPVFIDQLPDMPK
jgi:hypothetical protein